VDDQLLWESDVVDWEKIGFDAYKFVIEQAKERLAEVIKESHAVTKSGMTILLCYIATLSGLSGYVFSEKFSITHETDLTIILAILIAPLSIYAFSLLFKLIYPRDVFFKGSPPKEILFKEIFEGMTEQEGLKNILLNEIERIQDKIEKLGKSNKKRFSQYRRTLKISLFFIAIVIFIIVQTVYNQS